MVSEVSDRKLRGGYYTPDFVVDSCITRVAKFLAPGGSFTVLEPAAGDGAFVRGLSRSPLATQAASVICVEKDPTEAAKCSAALAESKLDGRVLAESFFDWAAHTDGQFDCVLGNPPFVRYQFVPPADRLAAELLLSARGVTLAGVSNLYIPFVLVALPRLRAGGAFAMVLPSEVLCTTSGAQIRSALLAELDDLQVDLFPRDAFPDILQVIVVFSGR